MCVVEAGVAGFDTVKAAIKSGCLYSNLGDQVACQMS